MAPVVDYASIIWAPNTTKSALSKLDTIQQIAAQAIIGGFKTVVLHTAESEANLQNVQERVHQHKLRIWIKLHSKPLNHKFWQMKKALNLGNKTWISLLQKITLKFQKLDLLKTDQIHPYTKVS